MLKSFIRPCVQLSHSDYIDFNKKGFQLSFLHDWLLSVNNLFQRNLGWLPIFSKIIIQFYFGNLTQLNYTLLNLIIFFGSSEIVLLSADISHFPFHKSTRNHSVYLLYNKAFSNQTVSISPLFQFCELHLLLMWMGITHLPWIFLA